MTTTKPLRQIRTNIPALTLARLAYFAAESGISVPQLAQAILIDAVAQGRRPVCLDGIGEPADQIRGNERAGHDEAFEEDMKALLDLR